MKKSNKSIKSIKTALVISAVAMIIGLIGVILGFVMDKKWDAAGCSILCCNAVIFSCNYDALKKAAENKDE